MSNNQIPGTPERFTLTGADPTTIPEPSQISGVTMTAAAGEKNVTIDSALDTGQLAVGDSLWDNTNFERREVEEIYYDRTTATDETYVRLKTAFTNAQSGDDVYVVKNRYYREVSIDCDGTSATIEGVAYSGTPFTWEENAGLRPIDVDPNNDTLTVNTKR